jgi:hypothetical protein
MTKQIGRRAALGAIGGVGVGALLAACGGGGGERTSGGASNSTGAPRATTTTGGGATTAAGSSVAGLFDDAASCSVTPQQTEGPFYFDTDRVRRDIDDDQCHRRGPPLHVYRCRREERDLLR